MFVAWRDLRAARGRFALIISVVILITLLVGLLSGLLTGLRDQNISAIADLPAERIIFSAPAGESALSFNDSVITQSQLVSWTDASDGATVSPIGISMGKLAAGDHRLTAALFGVPADGDLTGRATGVAPQAGELVFSRPAAESLNVAVGDTVTIADQTYRVAAIGEDAWFSHTPVVWMPLADWQRDAARADGADAAATILAVSGLDDARIATINASAGTVDTSVSGSFDAIGGFRSENRSLLAMLGMLLAISGLVIGAFFTVWTIQRTKDIAILKALGASTASLVRDALGQALVVLTAGVGAGIGLTLLLGQLASKSVPFVSSAATTLLPGALLVVLGLIGAAFALRTVVAADPLTAIGSSQ